MNMYANMHLYMYWNMKMYLNMNIYRMYMSMFMTCKYTKKRHGHLHGKGSGRGRDRGHGRGQGHGICRILSNVSLRNPSNLAEYNVNAGGSSEVRKEKVRRNFGPMEFRGQNQLYYAQQNKPFCTRPRVDLLNELLPAR
jgi:hypothetical protein